MSSEKKTEQAKAAAPPDVAAEPKPAPPPASLPPTWTWPPKAGDIMTRSPLTLELSDTLEKAVGLMMIHKVSHIPVLEREKTRNRLAGVLSDRDLLRQNGGGMDPLRWRENRKNLEQPVHLFMARSPSNVSPAWCIHEIAARIFTDRISSVLVTEQDNHEALVGIITAKDILRAAIHREQTAPSGRPVEHLMQPATVTVTVTPETSLHEVFGFMRAQGLRNFPVLEKGNVVSMISDRDVLRHLAPRRPKPRDRGMQRVLGDEPNEELKKVLVGDIMNRDLAKVSKGDAAGVAGLLLSERRINGMPVLGPGKELAGIITTPDFVRWVASEGRGHCMPA